MARISPLQKDDMPRETRVACFQHKAVYQDNINNAKATLSHSLTAFQAYMQWYPLFEDVKHIVGERLAWWYARSIAEACDSTVNVAFISKRLREMGEDAATPALHLQDHTLLDFGAAIARHQGFISDEHFDLIRERFTAREVVVLTAFAGLMIASSVFNNVIQTDLDENLLPYIDSPTLRYQRHA